MTVTRRASTVQAVRDDLVDRLTARLGATVLVREDPPRQVPDISERVYFEGAEDIAWIPVGQQGGRQQSYALPVIVEVRKVGIDDDVRRSARDRLWEIVDQLDAELQEDDELGGVAEGRIESAAEERVYAPTDGWLAWTRVIVRIDSVVI